MINLFVAFLTLCIAGAFFLLMGTFILDEARTSWRWGEKVAAGIEFFLSGAFALLGVVLLLAALGAALCGFEVLGS